MTRNKRNPKDIQRRCRICLTRGMFAVVDPEDYARLSSVPWLATQKRDRVYATRISGTPRRLTQMHRLIMNAGPDQQVDHINGDSLDNRKSNLRLCSHAENLFNRGATHKNKSGLKGVHKKSGNLVRPFVASIAAHGIHIHLGYFETAELAARAYDRAAVEHHGRFAKTNF